jgi:hypothetical protein
MAPVKLPIQKKIMFIFKTVIMEVEIVLNLMLLCYYVKYDLLHLSYSFIPKLEPSWFW